MRRLSMCALLVVSMLAACKPAQVTSRLPGEVTMKLVCLADGGFEFSLSPWSVSLPDSAGSFTWINDQASNVDAEITSQNPHFPFNGQSIHATHGGKGIGKPVSHTPAGRYKYNVTANCPGGGPKVVIDPDMIIPTLIE